MPLPFHRRRLDPDAADFIRRSGATDRAAINAFVRGVKALGLWNNMVCWPLRSAQNAGFGSTAYSLGGLGRFDGTLVNAPGWTADGIFFADNTSEHVLTTFTPSISENFNVFAAFQCNAEGPSFNVIASSRVGSGLIGGFSFAQSWSGVFRAIVWASAVADCVGPSAITDGSYNTATMRGDISTSNHTSGITVNGGAETTVTTNGVTKGNPAPLILGLETSTGTRSLGGNLPFVAYLKVSSFNNAAFRALYKQTLGTGLGLP